MVTLPVVSKRKGKIFWKPKVEPQFFWVQDNCWHFVLCGCGVDIECLWAHGYNTLKYTTLKHPYYNRIDETVSWLFLISPMILAGAPCIFLANDELKNPRLPQNHRVVIKRPLGPNALWSQHPCRKCLQGISIQEAHGRLWRLRTKTFWDFLGSVGWCCQQRNSRNTCSFCSLIYKKTRTHTHTPKEGEVCR